jgi:hypothetical protein
MLPDLLTSYLKNKIEKKFENPMNLYENIRDDGLLSGVYGFAKDKLNDRLDRVDNTIENITDPFLEDEEEEEEEESNFADIYANLLTDPIPSVGELYQDQQQMNPFSDLAKDLSFLRPESEFKIGY